MRLRACGRALEMNASAPASTPTLRIPSGEAHSHRMQHLQQSITRASRADGSDSDLVEQLDSSGNNKVPATDVTI
jgi:hypothetical protein